MRIERHPTGVWVREDGCVYLPKNGNNPAHWTFGCKGNKGYLSVSINCKNYYVHRLVAETFLPNPENKPEIDHIDRNPSNNSVVFGKVNLRWCTHSENNRNTTQHDRVDSRGGTHRYDDVKQYDREKSKRRCKTHKNVRFSDGERRWVPNSEAAELLKLPVKERV